MACPKCGATTHKHETFCAMCGEKLDTAKQKKTSQKSEKKTFRIAVITIGVVLLIAAVVVVVILCTNVPAKPDDGIPDEYLIALPDAEGYYNQNADILSKENVEDAATVLSESDVYALLTERGFGQYPITSSYSLNGTYSMDEEISSSSIEKHPMYETAYVTQNDDVWIVFVINDTIIAEPVSINAQSGSAVPVMVSEKKSLVSYDAATNRFFSTTPNESALSVMTVDTINAATLEKITAQEVENYGK